MCVQSLLGLSPCLTGIIERLEHSNKDGLTHVLYAHSPRVSVWVPTNPLDTTQVVGVCPLVLLVFCVRTLAQILNLIVGRLAVNVIEQVFWLRAVAHVPDNPVQFVCSAINTNIHVAAFMQPPSLTPCAGSAL
jgi:hypothetical protein